MDTLLTSATFWGFLDNLSEGIAILEVDGSILYVNEAAKKVLDIYQPVSDLSDLYKISGRQGQWNRWKQFLNPPRHTSLETNNNTISVKSQLINWNNRNLIQLIITSNVQVTGIPQDATTADFHQYIHQLTEENRQLLKRAEQIERLEIISDASSTIASSLEADSVLIAMGDHMLEAIKGIGYSIYKWSTDRQEVELIINHTEIPEAKTAYESSAYNVDQYGLLKQLLEETSLLITQVEQSDTKYVPGKPLWLLEGFTYKVFLLPIFSGGEPYGFIVLATNDHHNDLDENELQLLAALINQAGVALEKVNLFEDIIERESFLAALGRVSLAINATLDLPTVLSLICQESLTIFNADGVYIWQKQGQDKLVGLTAEGYGSQNFVGSIIASPQMFTYQIAKSGESQYINNFKQNEHLSVHLPQPESIESIMGIPLVREGDVIGVMVLVDRRNPERYTIRDIDKANAFAVQVAITLHNAQLVTKLRVLNEELDQRVARRTQDLGEERDRFQMLLRITTELSSSLDEDRVLMRALELVNEVVNATQGSILLINESTNEFIIRAAFGIDDEIPPRGKPSGMMRHEGLAGWIIENREAALIHNTKTDSRWKETPNTRDYRSALGVPLVFSDEIVGVLNLFHKEPNAFSDQQLRLVEAAATQVSNAVYNAHLYLLIQTGAERLGSMLREEQVNAAKMQSMLESIADGVLVADEKGKVILVNVVCGEILSIPRDEILGQNVHQLSGVYGSSGDAWIQKIQEWANNSDQIEGHTFLLEELKIADEEKIVSVHVAPVFASGQFFGTVSIFRDRTKEVEVDRVKSEFVSTVSHELRTPLTSIKGYTDLMLMGAAGKIPEAQERYLRVIKNNADRLQELVNDLLEISRLETGKTQLELRPIDLKQIVKQVCDHLNGRVKHEEKQITVNNALEDQLPLAHADFKRVGQILTNLVDNAFNYTLEGGSITISTHTNKHYIYVSVSDTGIGISKDNQDKIYDRFYRSDDARVQKVSGTGLGLAIVRSLVEMHGGKLKVDSQLGKGSTFTFNLPYVRSDGTITQDMS